MQWLIDFVTNPYIIAGISSWLLAQIAKFIIYAIVNKTFDLSRLHGDGGMPSGHSATVGGLTMMCALMKGFASAEFAIAFVLATIVCHDAMNVRLESGKHAAMLNDIMDWFKDIMKNNPAQNKGGAWFTEEKFKEFLGHTKLQVYIGVALGALNALGLYFLFFA
jgi:acid phosphatase family membrane protein YuiD